MTQNKKFKKQVRARMEKTGETYTQARRALLDDERGTDEVRRLTYRLIGYWKSVDEPGWPDPVEMVDASWDAEERRRVVEHLRRGRVASLFMGSSWCRLGCGRTEPGSRSMSRRLFDARGTSDAALSVEERRLARREAAARAADANMTGETVDLGSRELTDGTYVWPEGLAHYVERHNVRLPREFVEHALRGEMASVPEDPAGHAFDYDASWWRRQGAARRIRADARATGDSLGIVHDAESWRALGGSEEERQEVLQDFRRVSDEVPRILEVETPFNAGWYFYYAEYPDEGSQGPYRSLEDARQAARLAELDPDDPDEVIFVEQRAPAHVVRRFAVEHMRARIARLLGEHVGTRWEEGEVRRAMQSVLVEALREETRKLEQGGVLTPPDEDVVFLLEDSDGEREGVVRGRVLLKRPERYPDFVRDLAEMGIVDPRYLISTEIET